MGGGGEKPLRTRGTGSSDSAIGRIVHPGWSAIARWISVGGKLDYYTVLGVSPKASVEEIERAYRRLARQVHPDRNSGDAERAEARMKQLNQIRDTLTDPLLRAAYDDRLRQEQGERRPPPPPRP